MTQAVASPSWPGRSRSSPRRPRVPPRTSPVGWSPSRATTEPRSARSTRSPRSSTGSTVCRSPPPQRWRSRPPPPTRRAVGCPRPPPEPARSPSRWLRSPPPPPPPAASSASTPPPQTSSPRCPRGCRAASLSSPTNALPPPEPSMTATLAPEVHAPTQSTLQQQSTEQQPALAPPPPPARPAKRAKRRSRRSLSLGGKLFGVVGVLVALIFGTNGFSITAMQGMADSSEELAAVNEFSELRGEIALGAKQAQLLFQEMLSAQDRSTVAELVEEQEAHDAALTALIETYAACPAS